MRPQRNRFWFPLMVVAALLGPPSSFAAEADKYRVVNGWPVLPDHKRFAEVTAVASDSRGDVFVLTRAMRQWPESDQLDQTPIGEPTVFLYDGRTGALKASWGAGIFALPHGMTVDAADHVWVADVALHQVFEFTRDGKLVRVLGERGKSGNDRSHFNRPTDVAVAADGSIYVSDGNGHADEAQANNRIVKLDKVGRFLMAWGRGGSGPGELSLPHALTVGPDGRVYVVDRGNARIQIFSADGRYLAEWKNPRFIFPQDIAVRSDGAAFIVESVNEPPADKVGILQLGPDGGVIQRIGRFGNYDGQLVDPHGIALDPAGNLIVADFGGRRVFKYSRK